MKKIKYILLLFLLVNILTIVYLKMNPEAFYSRSEIAHVASLLFNLNTFNISDSDKNDELRITWIVKNSVGIEKEFTLYEKRGINKKSITKNRLTYGENIFIIYLYGQEVKRFVQIKENNWNFYKYNFIITHENIELVITGE